MLQTVKSRLIDIFAGETRFIGASDAVRDRERDWVALDLMDVFKLLGDIPRQFRKTAALIRIADEREHRLRHARERRILAGTLAQPFGRLAQQCAQHRFAVRIGNALVGSAAEQHETVCAAMQLPLLLVAQECIEQAQGNAAA